MFNKDAGNDGHYLTATEVVFLLWFGVILGHSLVLCVAYMPSQQEMHGVSDNTSNESVSFSLKTKEKKPLRQQVYLIQLMTEFI